MAGQQKKGFAFAPPTLQESKAAPSPLTRAEESGKKGGKTCQVNFQCDAELKMDIKLTATSLGLSQQDYLEKMHLHYKASFLNGTKK